MKIERRGALKLSMALGVAALLAACSERRVNNFQIVDAKDKGLPFTPEEIKEKLQNGELALQFYEIGGEKEYFLLLYPEEGIRNVIKTFERNEVQLRDEIPQWIIDASKSEGPLVVTVVNDFKSREKIMVGYRNGYLLGPLSCEEARCTNEQLKGFISLEFSSISRYTQDKGGMLAANQTHPQNK